MVRFDASASRSNTFLPFPPLLSSWPPVVCGFRALIASGSHPYALYGLPELIPTSISVRFISLLVLLFSADIFALVAVQTMPAFVSM
jgi:hypothetical protein